MIRKFWTLSQRPEIEQITKRYDIPEAVFDLIKSNLKILDDSYGADRSFTADGGYVALLLPEGNHSYQREYEELLQKYYISDEDVEFRDVVCTDQAGWLWKCDTYILNEYAVIIIYSAKGK